MSCFLVTFHVQCSDTRQRLEEQIRTIDGTCWNGLEHVWMINTALTGLQVRTQLRSVSGQADKIIVALLAGWAIWHGFDGDAEAWLTAHL